MPIFGILNPLDAEQYMQSALQRIQARVPKDIMYARVEETFRELLKTTAVYSSQNLTVNLRKAYLTHFTQSMPAPVWMEAMTAQLMIEATEPQLESLLYKFNFVFRSQLFKNTSAFQYTRRLAQALLPKVQKCPRHWAVIASMRPLWNEMWSSEEYASICKQLHQWKENGSTHYNSVFDALQGPLLRHGLHIQDDIDMYLLQGIRAALLLDKQYDHEGRWMPSDVISVENDKLRDCYAYEWWSIAQDDHTLDHTQHDILDKAACICQYQAYTTGSQEQWCDIILPYIPYRSTGWWCLMATLAMDQDSHLEQATQAWLTRHYMNWRDDMVFTRTVRSLTDPALNNPDMIGLLCKAHTQHTDVIDLPVLADDLT